MKIYHQLGHNFGWNLESFYEDETGDGLIIAPRFMERSMIEGYASSLKSRCLFDPQFFKPHIPKNKLSTYEFFPEILANGFETSDYVEKWADKAARSCVTWQADNDFGYIVIPHRYEDSTPSDFIRHQEDFFVAPFLRAIKEQCVSKKVVLQLVANQHMLLDTVFRNDLLNWLTGREGIHGVYLIVEVPKRTKQLKDIKLLCALLTFIDILRSNSLEVLVGYTNTEAFLLAIADVTAVTLGSYETMRIFDIRSFEPARGSVKSPSARIYTSRLLHWIDQNYVDPINDSYGGSGSFFDQTEYQAEMFRPTFQWHFQKPELYKHYFMVFSQQLRQLSNLSGRDRWQIVCKQIDDARKEAEELERRGIALDMESSPSHLGPWLTAAKAFGNGKGWD